MNEYIYAGEVGTIFEIIMKDPTTDLPIDISAATLKKIFFQDPSGNKEGRDAVFLTDGKDGIIQYTSVEGDIDQEGIWKMQGYIEIGDSHLSGGIVPFPVLDTLYVEPAP
mgnify:CR=1 FL=1